ncbi:hypothetical protein niasHT_029932 [Heterodera trifolii]|uniref:Uncharacterized protein n=1 Tax=Heterodera trifolii TaxID=157864 RepID=A0ABD2KFQ9_9BILA
MSISLPPLLRKILISVFNLRFLREQLPSGIARISLVASRLPPASAQLISEINLRIFELMNICDFVHLSHASPPFPSTTTTFNSITKYPLIYILISALGFKILHLFWTPTLRGVHEVKP